MRNNSLNIAVLVSGSGSNLQALIDAQNQDYFLSKIKIVISNKADSFALKRAENAGIKTYVIKENNDLKKLLIKNDIDLIVLAGYLKIVSEEIIDEYKNKIINIHPSLLPKYGGRGMYGINVHRAIFRSGEKDSGATVHKVTNVIDDGEIIVQNKTDIGECKSAEEIQQKVLKIEHNILKKAIKIIESDYNI